MDHWSLRESCGVGRDLTVTRDALNKNTFLRWTSTQNIPFRNSPRRSTSTLRAHIWSVTDLPGVSPDSSGLCSFSCWPQNHKSDWWAHMFLGRNFQKHQSAGPAPCKLAMALTTGLTDTSTIIFFLLRNSRMQARKKMRMVWNSKEEKG